MKAKCDSNSVIFCKSNTAEMGEFKTCEREKGHSGKHMTDYCGKRKYWSQEEAEYEYQFICNKNVLTIPIKQKTKMNKTYDERIMLNFGNGEMWQTTMSQVQEYRRRHFARIRHKPLATFKMPKANRNEIYGFIKQDSSWDLLVKEAGLKKVQEIDKFIVSDAYFNGDYKLDIY